ncbi:hypothetical protein D3C84_766800 [compost metagenome]
MAGIQLRDHLLGTNQVVGIALAIVHAGGGQAHGFQIGGEEAITAIQRQQDGRGYHHSILHLWRLGRQRLLGTPEGDAGKGGKAQQGQQ